MTQAERLQFIEEELKGLWPQWTCTEAEMRVWMGVLADYDYGPAQKTLQQCFCEQMGNYTRPRPAPLLARLRSLRVATLEARRQEQADIQTRVFLECVEAPPWNLHLAHRRVGVYVLPVARLNDVDYVRRCAESMRQRCPFGAPAKSEFLKATRGHGAGDQLGSEVACLARVSR